MVVPITSSSCTCTLSLNPWNVWWTIEYNYLKPFLPSQMFSIVFHSFGRKIILMCITTRCFPRLDTLRDLVVLIGSHYQHGNLAVEFSWETFCDGPENQILLKRFQKVTEISSATLEAPKEHSASSNFVLVFLSIFFFTMFYLALCSS